MSFALALALLALDPTAAPPTSPADEPAKTAVAEAPKALVVLLDTSMGPITLELNRDKAPISVDNFVKYVRSGHYDGTIFHRVIPNFMIQGGGMNISMIQKPARPPIKNEHSNGLKNDRGTVAMARTGDPHSATSQFFINVKDNGFLDQGDGYAVFGKVTEGMDVADKIAVTPTKADVPRTPITINKVRVVSDPKATGAKPEPKPEPKAEPKAEPKKSEKPAAPETEKAK